QAAHRAYAARTLEEARNALHRADFAGTQLWLSAAREAGADGAGIDAVNNDARRAQETAANAAAKGDTSNAILSASALDIAHYVAPEFPLAARERAMTGWVELEFMVKMDGSVSDVSVVGADPAGVFETPATEAVRKWKYQPVLRDGKPINQRA